MLNDEINYFYIKKETNVGIDNKDNYALRITEPIELTENEFRALFVCVEKCAGRYTEPLSSKLIDQLSIKLKGLI